MLPLPLVRALLPLALLLLLLPPPALAAGQERVTLRLDVQPDLSERLALTFEGLDTRTQYEGICLPRGAGAPASVRDGQGDLPHEARLDDGRYELSFRPRTPIVTIEMSRPAPDAPDAPFVSGDVNFCVPTDSRVRVEVRVPEGHALFFAGDGGTVGADGVGVSESEGPTHVHYAYEAPPPEGTLVLDEGPFRVAASPPDAEAAREVARLASAPLARALAEAGLSPVFSPLRVRYGPAPDGSWEAGHYGGKGYVTIDNATLARDPKEGWPYVPTKVLVHEAFHAASVPTGTRLVEEPVAWWVEGTARLAERQVDADLPNGSRHCEESAAEVRCWGFDDRISADDLAVAYDPSFTFDVRWEPSLPQPADTRRLYYQLSEYVVGAWVQQHGAARYREAWDRVEAALATGEGCPCGEGWLVATLAEVSGSRDDVFRPYATLRAQQPDVFEARVAPLVQDEDALQEELARRQRVFPPLLVPAPGALLAVAAALIAARAAGARASRRRR